MLQYFLKRLLQSILVMLIVGFVSFSLFNFVGDPVNNMVGQEASEETREEIREKLGLNDPVYIQFFKFVVNASNGEFGLSYELRRPVSLLISERLPATLELVLVSAFIAIFFLDLPFPLILLMAAGFSFFNTAADSQSTRIQLRRRKKVLKTYPVSTVLTRGRQRLTAKTKLL